MYIARLQPPLAPLRPGSYDFGRDLYFQGIGASGFVMGAIKEPPASGGLSLRYAAFMQGLRDAIDARIRNVLEGDKRAIATALLTGRRDAITEPVNDAMFISGLGHVLSISGYHMAVGAGVAAFRLSGARRGWRGQGAPERPSPIRQPFINTSATCGSPARFQPMG
jgi:competence protein ComEC